MVNPREAAIHFEAVKVSTRQNKDGTYITLVIHPSEVPVDLIASPVGLRYMVAMVQTDDHGEPVKGKDADEGDKAVQSAAMLCRNPKFQKWMQNRGHSFGVSEDDCAAGLRAACNIQSRSEFKTDRLARKHLDDLKVEFENAAYF